MSVCVSNITNNNNDNNNNNNNNNISFHSTFSMKEASAAMPITKLADSQQFSHVSIYGQVQCSTVSFLFIIIIHVH